MNDRLYRSRTDRVLSGVAGGVAERLDVDPSIVRVVWVILAFMSGGLLALVYLVMMVVVPEAPFDAPGRSGGGVDPWSTPAATGIRPAASPPPAPAGAPDATAPDPDATSSYATVADAGPPVTRSDAWFTSGDPDVPRADTPLPPDGRSRRSDRGGGLILGLILILIGAYFLAREYLPEVDLDVTWPVVVVAVGVVLVLLALVPSRSRD